MFQPSSSIIIESVPSLGNPSNMAMSLAQILNQPFFEGAAQKSILYEAYVDIQKILYDVDGMFLRGFPGLPRNEYAPEAAAMLNDLFLRSSGGGGGIGIIDKDYPPKLQTFFEQFKAEDSITTQMRDDLTRLTVSDIQTSYDKAMCGFFHRKKEDIGEMPESSAIDVLAVFAKLAQCTRT